MKFKKSLAEKYPGTASGSGIALGGRGGNGDI